MIATAFFPLLLWFLLLLLSMFERATGRARGGETDSNGHQQDKSVAASHVAAAAAILCAIVGLAVMAGEMAGWPAIVRDTSLPMPSPAAVLCFLLLSAALLARSRASPLAALWLLGASIALSSLSLLALVVDLPSGVQHLVQPARPAAVLQLLLIAAALAPATASGRRSAKLGLSLATLSLLYALLLVTLCMDGVAVDPSVFPLLMMSLPGAVMALGLAIGVVIWRYRDGWPALFWRGAQERLIGGVRLPIVLLALLVIQLAHHIEAKAALPHVGVIDAVFFVAEVAIMTGLAGAASYLLAQRRAERDDLASAVEFAAVMVVDCANVIQHWSRGCEDLYGWTAAQALGRKRQVLLQSKSRNGLLPLRGRVAELSHWSTEIVERHRDGHILVVHNQAKALRRDTDDPSVVNIISDVTAQRHVETELRKNEARLRAVIDVHDLTVVEWDLTADRLDWSINLESMFGRAPDGCTMDAHIRAVVESAEHESVIAEARQAVPGQGELLTRTVTIGRDGEDRVIDVAGRVMFDDAGAPKTMIAAGNDVTDHYRHEEAIRLSEARLATAVAAQGIFIYEYDAMAGGFLWTTSGANFFGVGPAANRDDPTWLTRHFPDVVALMKQAIRAAVAEGRERLHFGFSFRRADGTLRHAESWASIVHDAGAVRVVGTHLDVTESTEREAALRLSEAEMRAVLATVPDAMLVCDADGLIRSCSTTTERLLGCDSAGLVGTNILDLTTEVTAGRASLRRQLTHLLAGGTDLEWPLATSIRRPDGETIPVSFLVGSATVEGQRLLVIFARDLRPDIAATESYHRLQSDLAQVSRVGMMGEMAGALAHELSQPLAAIVNFLGAGEIMIETGADPARLADAIRSAGNQASRAGEIVRRLRAFIERGEIDMRVESVTSVIREAAALALFNMTSLGVRLSYEFESESREILADRIQIQQVLVNLIRNGVEALTSSGCSRREMIITTTMSTDTQLTVSVKDSGPGIGPEVLDMLFKPFTTTKREGLGFGLSISRRIIEAHGGLLTAETGEEGGATFRFTLPIMEEALRV